MLGCCPPAIARPRHRGDPRRRRRGARAGACGQAAGRGAAAVGAALAVAAAQTRGKTISVLMAYADRLERFTRWYVQLWAESLGKDGKGTTPIAALGPVDQHSQQQLFLAGPRDKLVTVITVAAAGRGPAIDATLAGAAGEPDFGGQHDRRSRRGAGPRHDRDVR